MNECYIYNGENDLLYPIIIYEVGEKMIDYDLHIHSNASDGVLSPNDICRIASQKGLRGFALTDHDTVGALREGNQRALEWKLEFIPGIEISCDYLSFEVHILGYFINYKNGPLMEFLNRMQQSREGRNREMIRKLQKLGYSIQYEEVLNMLDENNLSIGRPHIARLLVNRGYFKDINEAFIKLLGDSKPAYVGRDKVDIKTASEVILSSGGIPVIAHPLINSKFIKSVDIEYFIKSSLNGGILGIEAYHTLHTKEQEEALLKLAEKYNLAITGGSDCHGECTEGNYILGSKGIGISDFNRLKEIGKI